MISSQRTLVLSPYAELYDILIPETNFFRQLHDRIDYSFIYEELSGKYCPNNGRMAVDPIRMFKYLILKMLSDLSDRDLVEEVKMNMAYKFYLDMAPEDMPVEASTLCKFRRQRLKDTNLLDLLIAKTLEMAESEGLIKRSDLDGKFHMNVIIDGTHTVSNARLYRPVPALKEYSKGLRAQLYRCDETLKGKVESDHDISLTDLQGEIGYGYRLLDYISSRLPHLLEIPAVKRRCNRYRELLDDIVDHYNASPADPDARVGHKSADTEFFGYKTQIAMDEESRLVIGAAVTSGEVNDAIPGVELMKDISRNPDLQVEEMLGDTAYSGQPFLQLGSEHHFDVIAPPHPNLGAGIDGRDGFTFNKDADMFCCPMGHMAISKRNVTYKNDNCRKATIYKFDKEKCRTCPLKDTCLKKAREKTFSVANLTREQKDLLNRRQTDRFKERRRQRYKIEAKNAHLKQGYGYDRAKGKGTEMMELQCAVTIFASNMKIIFSKYCK